MARVYRESYAGTLEAGQILQDMVRIELPDRHMWVYPSEDSDGRVTVEFERKDASAELGFATTRELIEELAARTKVAMAQPQEEDQ